MVLASGPIRICQFKAKNLDEREKLHDMEPLASVPQSPLLSKSVDLNASPSSVPCLSHHNISLESASVSTNTTTNADAIAALTPKMSENIFETAALPQCLPKPTLSAKNDLEFASFPKSNEESATPRNTLGSCTTKKNAMMLPSVLPHLNKDVDMNHTATKKTEGCSSINIDSSSVADSIPPNDFSSLPVSNNTMGLVLTAHDKLQTMLTPQNIMVYKSVNTFGDQATLRNELQSSHLALKDSSASTVELASVPSNSETVEVGSVNGNATVRPKRTMEVTADVPLVNQIEIYPMENRIKAMDENAMGPTVINDHEVLRKCQNRVEPASSLPRDIKKSNSTSGETPMEPNLMSTNSSEFMINNLTLVLQNNTEMSASVPATIIACTSKIKSKSRSNSKTSNVKDAGSPVNKMEDGLSMPQNTSGHSSKPKTVTKCPSIDKMVKNQEKPMRRTSESKSGSSVLQSKAGTPLKTIIKSSSMDKMDKNLEKTRRTTESKSGPSALQSKAGTPSKTITKSPSIDKVDKMLQNKMVAPKTPLVLPSKPKAITKSPSVDKMDGKTCKKEKVPLSDASPVLTSERRPSLRPPWRGGVGGLAPSGFIRRSESSLSVNAGLWSRAGLMRPATSLPHIAKSSLSRPCLLVALRPTNLQQQKQRFFQEQYQYEPQFEYEEELTAVLDKYREGSGLFLQQAVGIMECVLKKYGSYENFEEVTGGSILPKSQVWAAVRKYLQKEGCVGEVVVRLSDELLSQAVMVVENCRPTLTINLSGARQHWLEGMLRHEIGTHYLRGVNNSLQPWASSEHRRQLGLKPANPTEEGLASLHSVLLRKQPYLWRAALLYYTVYHAASMSFSQLFHHIHRFVHNPEVRWEYCLRAKRGQTDTSKSGCFSKDQVYLDGILRILRHRRSIDFQLLTALGKVSYEDVDRLRSLAVLSRTRIPQFMMDTHRYMAQLDHIVAMNELDDSELEQLLP